MHKYAGFTLLESVFVIIIMGIIVVMSSKPLTQGLMAFTQNRTINRLDLQANVAIERMIRKIRTVRTTGNILVENTTQLQFVDGTNTTINYQLNGTTLQENGYTMVDNVSALSIRCYSGAGASPTTPALTRYVEIFLTIANTNVYNGFVYLSNISG